MAMRPKSEPSASCRWGGVRAVIGGGLEGVEAVGLLRGLHGRRGRRRVAGVVQDLRIVSLRVLCFEPGPGPAAEAEDGHQQQAPLQPAERKPI